MSSRRGILLLAIFFLDVRVRAENPAIACWGHRVPCAVKAGERPRDFKEPFTFVLGRGALAEHVDAQTIRLVEGQFYIALDKPYVFKTPYAQFRCRGECQALVDREMTNVKIKALAGSWRIKRTGEEQEYALDAGLQVTVSEVEDKGYAHMEFPQSLPWAPTVREWAKLYPGEVKDFKTAVRQFRADWRSAVESAAKVHEETATRAIASHEAEVARELARRKAEQKEEARLRALFREKNGLDP